MGGWIGGSDQPQGAGPSHCIFSKPQLLLCGVDTVPDGVRSVRGLTGHTCSHASRVCPQLALKTLVPTPPGEAGGTPGPRLYHAPRLARGQVMA